MDTIFEALLPVAPRSRLGRVLFVVLSSSTLWLGIAVGVRTALSV